MPTEREINREVAAAARRLGIRIVLLVHEERDGTCGVATGAEPRDLLLGLGVLISAIEAAAPASIPPGAALFHLRFQEALAEVKKVLREGGLRLFQFGERGDA